MKLHQEHFSHVRTGDEVVVISGGAKGRRGKVVRVLRKKNAVILEGLDDRSKGIDEGAQKLKEQNAPAHQLEKHRLIKPQLHHFKKSQQHPNGALLWLEAPIHASNVMQLSKFELRKSKRTKQ